jgi:DNA modification methylase
MSASNPQTPLDEHELEAVIERLRRGELLDDFYKARMFRQVREAELVYAAKEPRGSILARTMSVPLQPTRLFGDAVGGWTNKLIFGDNLQVLKTLLEMKERGELVNADGTHGFRMCYIDPPFATKREFRGSKGQRAYRDKIDEADFIEFLRKRLVFIHELLAEDGTLYVHLDTKKGHYVKVVLDELFGAQNFRNEIIWWYYNKMQGNVNRFPSNHDSIYVYGKGPHTLFTPVMEERDETATLIKRVWDSETGKLVNAKDEYGRVIYIEKDDKRVDDVWRLSMLQPADRKEKVDFPTQKPESLLSAAIAASSKPGDLVLDCFSGSGTAAVVAEKLGRRWVAVDSGKLAIYTAQRRLLSLKEGNGKKATARAAEPFELMSAGLYDNTLLEGLDFNDFEHFCLELFGCRRQPHTVVGVEMTGTRRGAPVYFFPWNKTDLDMGSDFVESLHERIKTKVTGPVCLVAPASRCEAGLFEDLIKLGRNVYFILRVPYSVIEALHGKPFQLVDQPTSKEAVNDAIESFGFSFIQKPQAETVTTRSSNGLRVELQSFRRGGLDPDDFEALEDAGRRDLAMVMVDRAYDGETSRLTEYLFGEDLEANGWSFEVSGEGSDGRVLLIWMDTHGNELSEVVAGIDGGSTHEEAAASAEVEA